MDRPKVAPVSEAAAESDCPAGLTAREVGVLRLVAVGLSDAEAAEKLFLSVRTVNAHLRSIYRKLGVSSRAAAGRFAEEHDLL
jgi:DNA-binding NarL/FixJ family response regulator